MTSQTLQPRSESDLSAAIQSATGPLRIVGGGTRPIGRPGTGQTLSTAGLSGITLYDPGALTLVVQSGTPLAEVEATLAAEGQRLAFEPMDHRALLGTSGQPTIGAVAACNISGPRRVQSGAARDFLLGLRFVDGAGRILKNGGRVMKNVTGYDLVKLLSGSYGSLGVLTEVAFKVLPIPETQATLLLATPDAAAAVGAMSAALGSPYEVSAAAFGPLTQDGSGPVALRVEGFAASVAYRIAALTALLAPFGRAEVQSDPQASAALWRDIRDVVAFRDHGFVARLSIKPSDLPALSAELVQGLGCQILADWGGGLVWVASQDDAGAQGLIGWLHDHCARTGGHATLIKSPGDLRAQVPSFQPEPAALAALTAGLRAKFDPRGLLNPGHLG